MRLLRSHDPPFPSFVRSVFGQFISLTDFASSLLLGYLPGYKDEKRGLQSLPYLASLSNICIVSFLMYSSYQEF
jgi:hypothetical protein